MLLDLCHQYRFRLHIVHLSTMLALPMLSAAKREGLPQDTYMQNFSE